MAEQAKALRLADDLSVSVRFYPQEGPDEPGGYESEFDMVLDQAAAELRRQHAEIERLTNLCYDYIGQLTAMRAAKQMQQRIDELKAMNGGRSAP